MDDLLLVGRRSPAYGTSCRCLKSEWRSLTAMRAVASPSFPQGAAALLGEQQQGRAHHVVVDGVGVVSRLAADRLGARPPSSRRLLSTPRACSCSTRPHEPSTLSSASTGRRERSPTVLMPRSASVARHTGPTPGSFSTGSGARNASSPPGGDLEEAVRLGGGRGDLADDLCGGEAGRGRKAELVCYARADLAGTRSPARRTPAGSR